MKKNKSIKQETGNGDITQFLASASKPKNGHFIQHLVEGTGQILMKRGPQMTTRQIQQQSREFTTRIIKLNNALSVPPGGSQKIKVTQNSKQLSIERKYEWPRLLIENQLNSLTLISKKRMVSLQQLNSLRIGGDNRLHELINTSNIIEELNTNEATHEENLNAKPVTCNCKKSKCLKLYCECFREGNVCGTGCSCVKCCNNSANYEERNKAKMNLEIRYPNGFKDKQKNAVAIKVIKGCNCKKSGCNKKYCDCFNSGQKCTTSCACDPCKNRDQISKQAGEEGYAMTFQQPFTLTMTDLRKPFNRRQENNIQMDSLNINSFLGAETSNKYLE